MAEKMPADLPPDRFPDAEQRERRMKYLASIQENWDWIEAHSTFPVKAPWDTETMLVEQLPKHLPLNKTLAHIWKMRIQEKAASGDVSGALADFSRSRADALISKVLKNLSKDKYERASDIARRCNCSSVEIHDYIGHRAECYFCHTKFYISSQECGDNEYETTTVKEPRS